MRLLFISLLLTTSARADGIMCHSEAYDPLLAQAGKDTGVPVEDKRCDGSCVLKVVQIGSRESWQMGCQDGGKDTGCGSVSNGVSCRCATDLCFTPEIAAAAFREYLDKKTLSIDFFNFDTSKDTPGGGNPGAYQGNVGGYQAYYSLGSSVFSTTSFLLSIAAFVLTTRYQ